MLLYSSIFIICVLLCADSNKILSLRLEISAFINKTHELLFSYSKLDDCPIYGTLI
jgi:hypothetical protein